MGVNISKIIPKKEIDLSDLKDKIIAVDAHVALYQFLTTIRQPDGTPLKDSSGNITSHLSGLFYRNVNLLQAGIKLVYVFDGKPPKLKLEEIEKRREQKRIAEEKYKEAKSKGDISEMSKFSKRTVRITSDMLDQSKELITALGIPIIQAPSEGEAEAALLAKESVTYASASQDYDSLLYETPYLIRNLTSARRKKLPSGLYVETKPELISLQEVFSELKINIDKLICLAILVGTDYNPKGVKGLGQKKALELVQQKETPEEIFKEVEKKYEIDFDWEKIFSQFKDYKLHNKKEIKFLTPDKERVKEILKRYEFSEVRINSALDKLEQLEEDKKQKGLSEFF